MPKRTKRAKVNDEPIILVDNPMKANRSVEDGTYGDVVPMPASASDGEGGTIPGAWTNDCRCTLYIDLQ